MSNNRNGWRKWHRKVYSWKSVTNLLEQLKLITKDKIIFVRQDIDHLTGNKIHLTLTLYLTTFWLFGKCYSRVTFMHNRKSFEMESINELFISPKHPYSSIYLVQYRRS